MVGCESSVMFYYSTLSYAKLEQEHTHTHVLHTHTPVQPSIAVLANTHTKELPTCTELGAKAAHITHS